MICPSCNGKGCPACNMHGEVERTGSNLKDSRILPEEAAGWNVKIEVKINKTDSLPLGGVIAQMTSLEVLARNGAEVTDYTLHNAAMIALMEVMEALRGHHTVTIMELKRRLEEGQ